MIKWRNTMLYMGGKTRMKNYIRLFLYHLLRDRKQQRDGLHSNKTFFNRWISTSASTPHPPYCFLERNPSQTKKHGGSGHTMFLSYFYLWSASHPFRNKRPLPPPYDEHEYDFIMWFTRYGKIGEMR